MCGKLSGQVSHEKAVTSNRYHYQQSVPTFGRALLKKKKLIILHSDNLHDKITAVSSMLVGFLQWEGKGLVAPRSLGMRRAWTELCM